MQLHRTPLARTATLSLATPLAHRTSRPHCRVLCSSSPTGNGPSCSERPQPPAVLGSSGRRQLLASAASLGFCTFLQLPSGPASAVPLGPLGPVQRVGGDKRTGLSAEEVAVGGSGILPASLPCTARAVQHALPPRQLHA